MSSINDSKNRLSLVAKALGDDLLKQVAFVGGCTTGLFLTDQFTKDLSRNKIRVSQTSEMVHDGCPMSSKGHHEHLFIDNRTTNAAVLPVAQRT